MEIWKVFCAHVLLTLASIWLYAHCLTLNQDDWLIMAQENEDDDMD